MRRNTKTMYEWRKAYRDKEELMLEIGFPEVSPHEFYRDLFPEGSLQSAEHDGKGNLIATLQFLSEQVWSPTTFASGLTEMTRQQSTDRVADYHSFFFAKKRRTE